MAPTRRGNAAVRPTAAPVQPVTVPVAPDMDNNEVEMSDGLQAAIEVHEAIAEQAATDEYQAMAGVGITRDISQTGADAASAAVGTSSDTPDVAVDAVSDVKVTEPARLPGAKYLKPGEHAKASWVDEHADNTGLVIVAQDIMRRVTPPNCRTPVDILLASKGMEMSKQSYNELIG